MNEVNFVSVLCDGSNDSAMSENEAIFVLYLDLSTPKSEKVQIWISFIKLVFLKSADALGLVDAIEDAFKTIDMDEYEKLVAFGADVMNTNSGCKTVWKSYCKAQIYGWHLLGVFCID